MIAKNEPVQNSPKLVWVVILVGLALLVAGSVFAADWMNYFYQTGSLYPAAAKPVITLIAFTLVLITGRHRLEKRDWVLLLLAFCCMLPTDILMSVVVVSPALSVGSSVFMIGGVLSIIAHIFLIIRVGRDWSAFRKFTLRDAWLPLLI